MTSSEDVLLEMPHVKHKKDDGRLYLMSERVAWIQGDKDVVTVSHKYADIKSQKISPEGKPKIQLQIVLHDNSSYTFHFVNPEGATVQFRDRDQVKELLIQLLPKFKKKINQELEEKNRLLSEHPKLLRLYKDLVIDEIITADEFWKDHAPQFLANQAQKTNINTTKQETGVSSGFLSGIRPETDGANGLRYNLTLDMIESIFKTYPQVKKKHLECVPSQMTDSAFWTKFFQSHYFHRDRLPLLKDLFSDCAKADDKEMRRELEKVKKVHSDIIAILEDQESVAAEGFLKDTEGPGGDGKDKDAVTPQGIYRNMIKRFNQHSIMVLKACERQTAEAAAAAAMPPPPPISNNNNNNNKPPGDAKADQVDSVVSNESQQPKKKKKKKDREERAMNGDEEDYSVPPEVKKAKIAEKLIYEDLVDDGVSTFSKLNLSRVDRYLNGPIPDFKTDVVAPDQLRQTTALMREGTKKWTNVPRLLDSVTAVKILGELRPGGALMKGRSPEDNSNQNLPAEIDLEIRSMYTSLSELLRHFWSCFPTTTPALEDKLQKTYETLQKFQAVKMTQLSEKLLRDHLSPAQLLSHANGMIGVAKSRYDQWLQRSRK